MSCFMESLEKIFPFLFDSTVDAQYHKMYYPAMESIIKGEMDLEKENIKVALMTPAFKFDPYQIFWSDKHECKMPDYSRQELSLKVVHAQVPVVVKTNTDKTIFTRCGNIEARFAVVYSERLGYADAEKKEPMDYSRVISCVNFGKTQRSFNGEFIIHWTSNTFLVIPPPED